MCNHKMKARGWVGWGGGGGVRGGLATLSYCFCLCFLCEYHLIYVSAHQSEHAD